MPYCVPVCVRDGEPLAKISVAGIEFQMGVTELAALIRCARMDIPNASGPIHRTIEHFLHVADNVCNIVCSLSPPSKPEDTEKNRKRWVKTGIGGAQEFELITSKLAKLNKAIKQNWSAERKKFIKRGQQLFT